MPSASFVKSVNLTHYGGGWICFDCPCHSQEVDKDIDEDEPSEAVYHLTLQNHQQAQQHKSAKLNWSHRLKLNALTALAPKENGRMVVDLLSQILANDGTISLNSYLQQNSADQDDMPILWTNIQLDGDIHFAINQKLLDDPNFAAYSHGFIHVQNAFMDIIEQTIKSMRRRLNALISTIASVVTLPPTLYFWQDIISGIVKLLP